MLIDTGATCTLVLLAMLGKEEKRNIKHSHRVITGVTGDNLEVVREGDITLTINGQEIKHNCVVVKNMRQEVIVGYDLLSEEGFVLDF